MTKIKGQTSNQIPRRYSLRLLKNQQDRVSFKKPAPVKKLANECIGAHTKLRPCRVILHKLSEECIRAHIKVKPCRIVLQKLSEECIRDHTKLKPCRVILQKLSNDCFRAHTKLKPCRVVLEKLSDDCFKAHTILKPCRVVLQKLSEESLRNHLEKNPLRNVSKRLSAATNINDNNENIINNNENSIEQVTDSLIDATQILDHSSSALPNNNSYLVPHLSPPNQPRRRRANVPTHARTYRRAIAIGNRIGIENELEISNCGQFRASCDSCGAKFFDNEKANRNGVHLSCCAAGDVILEPLGVCAQILFQYLTDEGPLATKFRDQIRLINSLFAMATFKANIPKDVNPIGVQGMWCFTISGQIYHHCQTIPSFTDDNQNLSNNQLYFVDVDDAVNRRFDFIGDRVPRLILHDIESMLRSINPLIQGYMTAGEVIRERINERGPEVLENLCIGFVEPNSDRQRRQYALPQNRSEIAAVFEGDPPFEVDLVVYSRNRRDDTERGRHELKNLNPLSDPMVYPLLFPCGERGYDCKTLRHVRQPTKSITFREFYRYRIQCRQQFSILHNAGKLFQQFLVDAWVKIESNYLWYLRQNRIQIRLANYDKIRTYLNARAAELQCRVGTLKILPATFQGGYRHQNRNYLDAMAVIARHGKPDLFITFTCSPSWPEISQNLQYKQKAQNRPDLICRVFNMKLMEFLDDLVKKQLYGAVLNYFYVIEFQKRGLPHAHILVTFWPEDKLDEVDKVDNIICAEIPDPETEPILYGIVAENYIHQVCCPTNMEAGCIKDGKCSKFFPKKYRMSTELNYHLTNTRDGRPEYRRRHDGRSIIIRNFRYTNRDVVAYNRYAALKYRCHINFEGVGSMASVKYLFKYVTKGEDMCSIEMTKENGRVIHWDEIKNYVDLRYVSSTEAAWRILELKLNDRSHAVMCLPIHLEDRQQIAFHEDEDGDEILDRADRATKLTAYFQLNQTDPDARQFKYIEIPEHYVWDKQVWRKRIRFTKMIANIVEVTAAESELFYLRCLLQHVRGATSFQNLRTLEDGTVCETYRETCLGMNMFLNADLYRVALTEASLKATPARFRQLYALIILISLDVGDNVINSVVALWPDFKDPHMIADYINQGAPRPVAIRKALNHIQSILKRNRDNVTLASIDLIDDQTATDEEVELFERQRQQPANEHVFETEDERRRLELAMEIYKVAALNSDQLKVYRYVVCAVLTKRNLLHDRAILEHFEICNRTQNYDPSSFRTNNDGTFPISFVDGPAGTGKTFLYNVIIIKFTTSPKHYRLKILTVAYTGIAASLLYGGQTVHRAFKLPLDLDEFSRAGWAFEDPRSIEMSAIDIILWDEVSMTSRFAIEAVDRYLRDVVNCEAFPFGGKVMLFGGDFRQTLPIVKRGSRATIISITIKASRLWQQYVTKSCFTLKQNLRASRCTTPEEAERYAAWLLDMGEGKLPCVEVRSFVNAPRDLVRIPPATILDNRERLIEWVYGAVGADFQNLNECVILCPTNAVVDEINKQILERLTSSVSKTYLSIDKLISNQQDDFYVPDDMLHATKASNLPPHELTLKVGAVVMLLRNIDISAGLCNGCRFVVRQLCEHTIELEVVTGVSNGYKFWLPQMILQSKVPELPNPIRRIQFPIRLAFAMTINKSQGQTFTRVGLYLPSPCFSHGQLYVAFSRVGTFDNIKTVVVSSSVQGFFQYRDGTVLTRNCVFAGVLGPTVGGAPYATIRYKPGWSRANRTTNNKKSKRAATDNGENDDDGNEMKRICEEKILMNLDLDGIMEDHLRRAVVVPAKEWDNSELPMHDTQTLRNRVSVGDRPGTSGSFFVS